MRRQQAEQNQSPSTNMCLISFFEVFDQHLLRKFFGFGEKDMFYNRFFAWIE